MSSTKQDQYLCKSTIRNDTPLPSVEGKCLGAYQTQFIVRRQYIPSCASQHQNYFSGHKFPIPIQHYSPPTFSIPKERILAVLVPSFVRRRDYRNAIQLNNKITKDPVEQLKQIMHIGDWGSVIVDTEKSLLNPHNLNQKQLFLPLRQRGELNHFAPCVVLLNLKTALIVKSQSFQPGYLNHLCHLLPWVLLKPHPPDLMQPRTCVPFRLPTTVRKAKGLNSP